LPARCLDIYKVTHTLLIFLPPPTHKLKNLTHNFPIFIYFSGINNSRAQRGVILIEKKEIFLDGFQFGLNFFMFCEVRTVDCMLQLKKHIEQNVTQYMLEQVKC